MQDVLEGWIPFGARDQNLKLFLFVIVFSVLWNVRNKRAVRGEFLREPIGVLFKICACLQKWKVRLRVGDRQKLDKWVAEVSSWMKSYSARTAEAWTEASFC